MGTLCTTQDVLDRATEDVDATLAASSAWIERLITTAEGVLVSQTRRDWVTDYANVDTYVKEILRNATACHAAKLAINYSTNGFFSLARARIALNVVQDEFIRDLAKLKDVDSNNVRAV